MSTMGKLSDVMPKRPARRSPRKANKTTVIRHQLLLEPTLERQERKRRLWEKERAKRQAPQFVKRFIELEDDDLPISKIIIPRRKVSPVTPDMVLSVKPTQEAKRKSETKKAVSKTPVDKFKTRVKKSETRIEKSMTRVDKPKKTQRPLRTPEPAPVPAPVEEERTDESVPKQRTPQRTPVPRPSPACIPVRAVSLEQFSLNRPPPASSPVRAVSLEQLSLDQLRIELAVKQRLTLLRRRKFAMQALMTAADMTTIFASLAIVKDVHQGDEFHPVAASLVNDSQITGQLLLTQSLMDRFTGPRSFGGLAFSYSKAQILSNHLFQTIGSSLGTIPITAEILVAAGFPVMDSIEMLPYIRVIVNGIREKIISLASMLSTVTSEGSLSELVARTHRTHFQ